MLIMRMNKILTAALAFTFAGGLTAFAQSEITFLKGDVNRDGKVDADDIVALTRNVSGEMATDAVTSITANEELFGTWLNSTNAIVFNEDGIVVVEDNNKGNYEAAYSDALYQEGLTYKYFRYLGHIVIYDNRGKIVTVLNPELNWRGDQLTIEERNAYKNKQTYTKGSIVTQITLSSNRYDYTEVGGEFDLTATVVPEGAAAKWVSSNPGVATVTSSGHVAIVGVGMATISCKADDPKGVTASCSIVYSGQMPEPAYVDLGLPSGVQWATHNIGAFSPVDFGNYYAWGELTTKESYSWENYLYGDGQPYDYETSPYHVGKYNNTDRTYALHADDDIATQQWGKGWRLPTAEELVELRTNCTWKKDYKNYGYTVTSKKNGNSIFLPANGYYRGEVLTDAGLQGSMFYWTSSVNSSWPIQSYAIVSSKYNDYYGMYWDRYFGLGVRPVYVGE